MPELIMSLVHPLMLTSHLETVFNLPSSFMHIFSLSVLGEETNSGAVPNDYLGTAEGGDYMGRLKCELTVKILTVNPFLFGHVLI